MDRENATELTDMPLFEGLDEAIAFLQLCKGREANVYIDFNGHKLYSCDITVESAYMEVCGMTKEENDAIREEYAQAKTEEEKQAVVEKWRSIKKAHLEAGDKKGQTILESGLEATEEKTETRIITGQVQGITDVSKERDEEVKETE